MRSLLGFSFAASRRITSKQLTCRVLRLRPTIAGAHHAFYKKSMSTSAPPEPPKRDPNMKPVSALFLLFPNFNTLDLNGPLETLAQAAGYTVFNNTIASATELTTAAEKLTAQRHISFSTAKHHLSEYDILIVPGAPPQDVLTAIDKQPEMLDIITSYAKLTTPSQTPSDLNVKNVNTTTSKERILMSVCTGAGFLGATGVLAGKKATSHWAFLETLKNITEKYAHGDKRKETDVVGARFVDGGLNKNGVRIITAGGISSGLDASLYLVSKKAGNDTANYSAKIMDYAWRLREGIIVQ